MEFSFDFDNVTATEMITLLSIDIGNPDVTIPYLTKTVVAWPYEGNPADLASYDNLDFPDVILLVRAINDAMVQFMSKPKVVKKVNLKNWKWADYSKWRNSATDQDWDVLAEQLKKVAKVDMDKMTGEDYLNLLGSINVEINKIGSQGN